MTRQTSRRTRGASIGKKIVIVAALLATSVMEVTIRQAMVTVAKGWRFPRGVRSSATQDDKPEIWKTKQKGHLGNIHKHDIPESLCMLGRSRNLAVCQDTASTLHMENVAQQSATLPLKILKTELAMPFGCLDQNRAGASVIKPHPSTPTPEEY